MIKIFLVTICLLFYSFETKLDENFFSHKLILKDINDNSIEFLVNIADTKEKQQKGLMFIKTMSDNQGMFFVWKNEKIRIFWMKNTFIPLDIIFFNSKGVLVDYHRNANPLSEELIVSKKPAKFVLEVKAGIHFESDFNKNKNLRIQNFNHINP